MEHPESEVLPVRPPRLARSRISQEVATAIGVGLFALGLYLWQLTVPALFAMYDTGVYLGAALHLVHGVLPYRDFTFMQPPGILLLMSPVALVGRVFGTHDSFLLVRVVSACVTALNAVMLAWLVRGRGRMAMLIAGIGLALLPVASLVSTVLRLDPYSIFFVLLASLVVFSGRRDVGGLSNRRLMVAGLLFGVAALVKLWAFFPFLALAICLTPRYRRRVAMLVGGAAASLAAVCLPFFLMAPRNFVSQVFVEQLLRKTTTEDSAGLVTRLLTLSGLLPTTSTPSHGEIIFFAVVFVALVAIAFWRRLPDESVDVYLLVAGVAMAAGLLLAPESYTYYGYYFAPFLLGVTGVSAARLGRQLRRLASRIRISATVRHFLSVSTVLGLVGVIFAMTMYATSFYTSFARATSLYGPYLSPVAKVIPAGSCVVYQIVAEGIYTNRFQSNDPKCPDVVDPYGMWMAWGYMRLAPAPPFVAEWKGYLEAAQYVVIDTPHPEIPRFDRAFSVIPWNRGLVSWFDAHYHPYYHEHYVYIFKKDLGIAQGPARRVAPVVSS